MAAVGGMCHAPMSALYYHAPRQLAAVRLTSGERSRFLKLSADGSSYVVPVRDKLWDDESLIVYEFAGEGAAPTAPAAQKEQGAAAP